MQWPTGEKLAAAAERAAHMLVVLGRVALVAATLLLAVAGLLPVDRACRDVGELLAPRQSSW